MKRRWQTRSLFWFPWRKQVNHRVFMSPTMYASCDWCPGLDPLTHILEEVLQFPSEWIENPSQASKLWNFAVVCLTFVSESQILSETVWKQIVRCNAQLAPCQRHLPVCVAMRLVLLCEYLFKLTIRMVKLETRQYDSIRSAIRIAPFFEAMREPSMTAGCETLLSREASGCEAALSREALLV